MYKLELSRNATKFIDALTPKEKIKVTQSLEKLSENPYRKDLNIKKLKGQRDVFRLRVLHYRILYKIYDDTLIILVFKAGHRRDIYK